MKNERPYQVCTKCSTSTDDDAEIYFDENGVCNHCYIPEAGKGKRIAMLLDNDFTKDKRVIQEAKTISEKFDLVVYVVEEKGAPLKEIRNGIRIHRIFPATIFKLQSIGTLKHIAAVIAKENYDVLHCHDHLMLSIGAFIKKRNPHTVLIYDSHELFHSWPINYSSRSLVIRAKSYLVRKYQVYVEKKSSRYIDYIITVNNSLANILSKYLKSKTEPLVIRNLPPYEKITGKSDILRKKFNIPAANKILVYIGMHVYPKTLNIEAVIDQVGGKPNLSFILICQADIYRKAIEDYVAHKGYKNIYFHELIETDQINTYLSGCEIGIVPTWNRKSLSYWYALDNKLFNYLMAEIPVLATMQPEYNEIIEKYNIGTCVNPDKPNAYYEGINWILQNYDALKQNIAGAKTVLTWENERVGLINFYDKIAIRKSAGVEKSDDSFLKPTVTMLLDNPFILDKRVYREATALVNEGYQVTLYAMKDKDLPEHEIVKGIIIKRVFDKSIFDIKQIGKFRRMAEFFSDKKIDILHCHDWLMLCVGSLIKKKNPSITLIYDSHELFYSWPINYSNRKSLWILIKSYIVRQVEVYHEKRAATRIDELITVSSSFGQILKKRFHFNKEPVIVKNIAKLEDITNPNNNIRSRFNIPASTKIVVNLSLYIYQKSRNIEIVIDQFANVEGVALVFICKDGGNKKDIVKMVEDRGIKNVFFHEPIFGKDIINTLASCDMGIVTTWNKKYLSYWYGLENKIFHYIMAEIPILATAQPEHLLVIDKYKIGLCVDADQPQAYLNGYYGILKNYARYKKNVIETKKFLHWGNEKIKLIGLYNEIEKGFNGNK